MMLTNMQLRRQAIRAWPSHPLATKQQTNHIRRQWMSKIELLGKKWLLHPSNRIGRKS